MKTSSEFGKQYRVLVLAMSTLNNPLDKNLQAFKNRYYKCEGNGILHKKNYHGIGQLEPIPQCIMEEFGSITHVIILATDKTKEKLRDYNWEKINEQIARRQEDGGFGDGAVIDLSEEEKANGLSAVDFFEKRINAFCKQKGISAPDYQVIDFDEENKPEEGMSKLMGKIRTLYQEYKNCNQGDEENTNWQLFVDVHGGLRDASFVIFTMIHTLSAPDEQDLIGMNEKLNAAIARLTDGKGTIPVKKVYTIYYDGAKKEEKFLDDRREKEKRNLIVDRTDLYNMFVRESFESYMNYGQFAGMALKSDVDPEADSVLPYAFISYRRLDAPKERFTVLGILKKNRYRYWYDDGIKLHENWQKKLVLANEKSTVFIALITKQYFQSYQCVKELRQALDEKTPDSILLFSTDGTSLYPPMEADQTAFTIQDSGTESCITIRKEEFEKILNNNHENLSNQMHHGVLDQAQLLDYLQKLCESNQNFRKITEGAKGTGMERR